MTDVKKQINEIIMDGGENFLTEMPQLIPATSFGLDDIVTNKALAKELLPKTKEVLETHKLYKIIKTGDMEKGYIAHITNDDEPQIGYLVKFATHRKAMVGRSVTQVAIWRSGNQMVGVAGITSKIFFDYLLAKWPVIMSDAQQTENGRDFWYGRLNAAYVKGFKIGMIDFNAHTVDWFDEYLDHSPQQWWEKMDGWGTTEGYQAKRFLISN